MTEKGQTPHQVIVLSIRKWYKRVCGTWHCNQCTKKSVLINQATCCGRSWLYHQNTQGWLYPENRFCRNSYKTTGMALSLYVFPTKEALALEGTQQRGHNISWGRAGTKKNGRCLSLTSEKGSQSQQGKPARIMKRENGVSPGPLAHTP